MDFRKTFDQIPEHFERYRPRYCDAVFEEIREACGLDEGKNVLEIGPGTGQATEPVLKTGCRYEAIELGEHFTAYMQKKFGAYSNFKIVNGDFETYDFGEQRFDLVYSAATIQWIPEKIAFSKTFQLLKPGGFLAMTMTRSDERQANEALYQRISQIYQTEFFVKRKYTCRMQYQNSVNYGFIPVSYQEWQQERVLTTDQYLSYLGTSCEEITLEEPYKSRFYAAVRKAVDQAGGFIRILDTIPLYLYQKPASS